jgi:hypothetical protein
MTEWLSRYLGRTVIELADGRVVAWSNALRGSPTSPQQLIELLIHVNTRIPERSPHCFRTAIFVPCGFTRGGTPR